MIVRDTAQPYTFRGKQITSAHLVSDLQGDRGQAELVDFATRSLGMRPEWLQSRGTYKEHFDVWGSRLKRCDELGVPVLERRDFVNILRRKRGEKPHEERTTLARAEDIAGDLVAHLRDSCVRLEVVGSVRRLRPDPKDVELLAIPRMVSRPDPGQQVLFGAPPTVQRSALWERLEELLEAGVITQEPDPARRKWGERYRTFRSQGLHVDLFTAYPEAWGAAKLIRTGPSAYSRRWVTELQRYGLKASGGRVHFVLADGGLGHVVDCASELRAFELARWDYVGPSGRR